MNISFALDKSSVFLEEPVFDVLIVDDVPDNIRFLSKFLSEKGYRVRKAVNGGMALIAIKTLIPDIILLDINLPDINGYDICSQLKANPETSSVPIIFLSASNEAIDKIRAFQIGASDYITKPFYLEEVLARIQTQLTIQNLQKELKSQNEQLKGALNDLRVAQANFVHQEKMSTLRKIVAGVAHEINNPLSFIACNIKPAQEYIDHLLTLINLIQDEGLDSHPSIQNYVNNIDLEFLKSDLVNIIDSMEAGAKRIHAVVLALRFFIRLDESGAKKINLNDSIEKILTLLQHRLSSRSDKVYIQIQTNYDNLPEITCHADGINQVFFNLLCNAIDAVEEKIDRQGYEQDTPQILIKTQVMNGAKVAIHFKDNGVGISDQSKQSIFEPFFTTKSAGQGLGLGLAISRRIIEEEHGGEIRYSSTIHEGSEFIVMLPIQ